MKVNDIDYRYLSCLDLSESEIKCDQMICIKSSRNFLKIEQALFSRETSVLNAKMKTMCKLCFVSFDLS